MLQPRTMQILLLTMILFALGSPVSRAARDDIALFFGSFDPPHAGHLAVIKEVAPMLGVEKVTMIPERDAPGQTHLASFEHRLAMCRHLAKWNREVDVPPQDLLDRIRDAGDPATWRDRLYQDFYQRLEPGCTVLDIMGMDRFNDLMRRKTYPRKQEPRMVVIVDRPGHRIDARLVETSGVPPGKFLFLHQMVLDVRSERVRESLQSGQDVAGWIPLTVRRYIRQNGLYRP